MRGESNHALLGDAALLGESSTSPEYELAHAGLYPAMVTGGAACVLGELYDVPTIRLEELDDYEGAPGLFERAQVLLSDGSRATGYVMPQKRAAHLLRIDGGSWRQRPRFLAT